MPLKLLLTCKMLMFVLWILTVLCSCAAYWEPEWCTVGLCWGTIVGYPWLIHQLYVKTAFTGRRKTNCQHVIVQHRIELNQSNKPLLTEYPSSNNVICLNISIKLQNNQQNSCIEFSKFFHSLCIDCLAISPFISNPWPFTYLNTQGTFPCTFVRKP